MKSLADAEWSALESLRDKINGISTASQLAVAAQTACELFTSSFESVVLVRLFIVLPFEKLPAAEQAFASRLAAGGRSLTRKTRVLCLVGTSGAKKRWSDRTASVGHLAIPLIDADSVAGAPMIAKLLSDLNVDLKALDDGRPIVTRHMLGGKNGVFYVAEAKTAQDARGRQIVADTAFVRDNDIGTVFGMGGSYADGTLAVMVVFCNEHLERSVVDRYASFIASFKMATAALLENGQIFHESKGV